MSKPASEINRSVDERARRFDYDPRVPLAAEARAATTTPEGSVQEVSFAGAPGQRLNASLDLPAGAGPYPAVIFLHPAPGDRFTFQEEAALLAQNRIASLLVEAPWAQAESFFPAMVDPRQASDLFARFTVDVRRAVDYLQARREIDGQRIALVGHSLGALVGGILAGVEPRLRTVILMAGTGSFTDVAALNMPDLQGTARDRYVQTMDEIDPRHYVARAAPRPLLFQFGEQDNFYTWDTFTRYAEAGSQPKIVRWYPTDHFFNHPPARQDRLDWLLENLRPAQTDFTRGNQYSSSSVYQPWDQDQCECSHPPIRDRDGRHYLLEEITVMKPKKLWLSILTAGVLIASLAACAPLGPTGQSTVNPAEATPATPPGELPDAAQNARAWLAEQLGQPAEKLEITGFEAVDWSDTCLGLGGPAESCAAVMVPGYRVNITLDGVAYEVRADQSGTQFRSPQVNPNMDALSQTRWKLIGFRDGGADTPAIEGTQVSLEFQPAGMAGGNASCNRYGGTYELNGNRLTFIDLANTEMACLDDGLMEQETRFLEALRAAVSYEIVDGQLVIASAEGQPSLVFEALPAAGDGLANTRWQLAGFRQAELDTPAVEGVEVSLEFQPGEMVVGQAGCNGYGGSYEQSESALTIKDLASTLMACADGNVMQQETRFLQALQAATAYEIVDGQLVITTTEGQPDLVFDALPAAGPDSPVASPTLGK